MPATQEGKARLRLLLLLGLLALSAGGAYWAWFATYHFAAVQEGVLYRAGNRSMREFSSACRSAKPRTIVALIDDQEIQKQPFADEPEYCRGHQIEFVRIPIQLGGRPTSDDVRRFLALLDDPKKRPVLVHCAQGVRRTGMMIAAWQQSALGYDATAAKSAIVPWGRKPDSNTLQDIRNFIDDYDPVSRTVGNAHATTRPVAVE